VAAYQLPDADTVHSAAAGALCSQSFDDNTISFFLLLPAIFSLLIERNFLFHDIVFHVLESYQSIEFEFGLSEKLSLFALDIAHKAGDTLEKHAWSKSESVPAGQLHGCPPRRGVQAEKQDKERAAWSTHQ